jgi:phosphoribosyl 1,2-cyclic phosphodiesterase
MIVRFWGVRGSVPTPGAHTLRYGGETSCLSVEAGGGVLVLDAGSGIRALGAALLGAPVHIALVPTHAHFDHTMGFPFFKPLYEPDRPIELVDCHAADRAWSLLELLDNVQIPLTPARLDAAINRRPPGDFGFLRDHGMNVRTVPLNHPGGATGFRIEHGGATLVHLTDNELDAPRSEVTTFAQFVAFCRGADLLVHDAQYVAGDMPAKWGWGHSSVERVCDLAAEAGVGRVVLFHHDPARSDAELDRVEAAANERLAARGAHCLAAREGLMLEL